LEEGQGVARSCVESCTLPPTRTQVIRQQVDLKSERSLRSTTDRLRVKQTQGSHSSDGAAVWLEVGRRIGVTRY
jgi:hypothetical protein